MKKLAFIVFTLCLPALAWAATGEPLATIQWNGTAHDGVFALARRGDELWAATNFGLLLKRGSKPWETAVKSNGNALLGIGFSPQGDGIAVGQNGLLMEVKPNSENWKTQNSGVKHRLMWVASNSRGDFLVVGAFGTVLYRAAGSDQWQKVAVKSSQGEEPHLYGAFFVSDDEALVVGENESLLDFDKGNIVQQVELGQPPASASSKSSPGGDQGDTVVTPSLFTVTYCDGMLVAAGQRGLVLSKSLAAETKAAPKPAPKPKRGLKKHAKAEQQPTGLLADWHSAEISGQPDVYGLACTVGGTLIGVSNNGTIVTGTRQAGTDLAWQTIYAKGLYAPWLSAVLPSGNDNFLVAGPANIWEVSFSNGK